MNNAKARMQFELYQLRNESVAEAVSDTVVTFFVASGFNDSDGVLERVMSVIAIVDEAFLGKDLLKSEWTARLPEWFISACAPAMTNEEATAWLAQWRALSPKKKTEAENRHWSLENWLYWMTPENRQWFWIGAELDREGDLLVSIGSEGWPFSFGSLVWLFRAAGASLELAQN